MTFLERKKWRVFALRTITKAVSFKGAISLTAPLKISSRSQGMLGNFQRSSKDRAALQPDKEEHPRRPASVPESAVRMSASTSGNS